MAAARAEPARARAIRNFARIVTLYATVPRDLLRQQVVNAVLRFLVTDGGP